jgi:hypothetical protein
MPKTDERDNIQRDVLPIPDHKPVALTTYTAKDPDTRFPPIRVLRPPAFAPNVLVVLIDDAGFGSSSAFGGPCQTPTAERLAKAGLKYTRFHTTALCSPTRAAMLSGTPRPPRKCGWRSTRRKMPGGSAIASCARRVSNDNALPDRP